jgi:hypothetical protein
MDLARFQVVHPDQRNRLRSRKVLIGDECVQAEELFTIFLQRKDLQWEHLGVFVTPSVLGLGNSVLAALQ